MQDAESVFACIRTHLFRGGFGGAVKRAVAEVEHDVDRHHDEIDAIKDKHVPL